jgi:hypothetical protein
MSLRNRARSLQKKTGLSYQRALAKLRALGEKPARLAEQTGWPLDVCDRFLTDGHAPIDVIEIPERTTLREACEQICETLRVTANARAVVLAAKNGAILASVGQNPLGPLWIAVAGPRRTSDDVLELGEGRVLHTAGVRGATLAVEFHRDETSLGLVKLRVRHAIEELDRLLALAERSPGMPPTGGRGGPSGLPAEVRVALPKKKP